MSKTLLTHITWVEKAQVFATMTVGSDVRLNPWSSVLFPWLPAVVDQGTRMSTHPSSTVINDNEPNVPLTQMELLREIPLEASVFRGFVCARTNRTGECEHYTSCSWPSQEQI